MPGDRLSERNYDGGTNSSERRDRQDWTRWSAQSRADRPVPEDLTSRAIVLPAIKRPGMPGGRANGCGRDRKCQRKFRYVVMVKHQHQEQVQLHGSQQPCGRGTP